MVLLSNIQCQDPLVKDIWKQCKIGRINENPNVSDFIIHVHALRKINSVSHDVKGNC